MARTMALVLSITLVPALALPGVANAIEPPVALPQTPSVPVLQQSVKPRDVDAATRNAISGDQDPRADRSGSGTTTATSLSPSATWDVATHTGDFTWSYPLRVPPAPGGLVPNLSLSYRSSAVDGRTSVTNNQPSWVGDGWDVWPGFVERTYGSCVDDGDPGPQRADLCWRSDNATAAYGGGGGMLICCDADRKWRAKNDDGSRIERLNGADNGDNDGEHWKITTVDGTQYWFGSQLDARSTWTVPVFGDDPGEPCYATSHCVQAWRWNLDKVVDRNGNVIRYFYQAETNRYGMDGKDAGVDYIRGGTLKRIDYGLNDRVAGRASGQVEFTTADRCLPNSVCSPDRKGNWPDTPLDRSCDTPTCKDRYSPTFWSTKRLSTITTKVLRGSAYDEVDRWTLDQQYPDPHDGGNAALWLKGIMHTGVAGDGSPIDLPPVTFEGTPLANRVYTLDDGYAPLMRYRISGVISESGGVTSVNYASQCTPTSKPANEWDNTMWCFPVTWAPPGHKDRTDYFHKYVVDSVNLSDMLSSSTDHVTRYEYLDGAAWHWDTSEFVKDKKKTWNEFRGFGRVRIRSGLEKDDPGGSKPTLSEERFYRGMNGDRLTREGALRPTQQVSDSLGVKRNDEDWLQGFGFETTTFENDAPSPAPAPPFVTRTIAEPVWQGPTAARGEFKAYIVGAGTQRGFTALKSGGARETKTTTSYDDRGLPTAVSDLGDVATAVDDRCTKTSYARHTGAWLLAHPSTVETVSVSCDVTPRFPDHAISASKFSYDGMGNLATTEVAKERSSNGPVYVITGSTTYDAHGRATEVRDAMGAVSRIAFTPTTGGPVTGITTTSPPVLPTNPQSGLVARTTLDPAFGQPTTVVDPNDQVTETWYDPLGRVSKVWLPNRPRLGDPPNPRGSAEFSYLIRRDGPSVVTSTKVGPNGVHTSSNTLYDGLLRPRQTQTPSVGMRAEPGRPPIPVQDGRLIVDTRYDSHGRAYKLTQPYFNSSAVDTNLWLASDTEVPGLTRTRFDDAGRAVESVYRTGTTDRWSTRVSYDGDRVHTTPPAGGTATTVITNARGQTTELRQYLAAAPTGGYESTSYRYTPAGQLAEVTGPDNAVWKFGYDLRGRKITTEDPDAGNTTYGYDDAGRLTSTRDARGKTIAFAYDALGRKTETRQDSLTGKRLARWTYDTATNGKGLGASSTRFLGERGEHEYTATVSGYTALGKPAQASVTIPAVQGLLAGTYPTDRVYGVDGGLARERYPAVGGLPEETVNYGQDHWGRPASTTTAAGVKLVAATLYTRYGEVERLEHGVTGSRAWQSFYYETSTRRLQESIVDAEVPAPKQSDVSYTHDPAGNITSIADQDADLQCFRHDHLRRLTEAWTPTAATGCGANPSQTTLSGPAPYWHSYRHGPGGNRLEETQRTRTTTTKRTYNYPTGPAQPHTLRSVTGGTGTETYEYNPAGFTTRRTKPGADETFNWDAEGHLESVTNTVTNQTTSFIYTPDGDRLLRKDPTGTTLYLGGQELRLAASGGDPVATRYYTHGGAVVAMRQGESLTWLAGDHQGTTQVAINTTTLQTTRRRQLPYGAPRGAALTWPGERGFVGGVNDASTGLTHLGAREYDPGTGRFISVDPIMNPADPQQMQGYAYANNNPITFSDPTGLILSDCADSSGSCKGLNPWTGAPLQPSGAGPSTGPRNGQSGGRNGGTYRNNPTYKQPNPCANGGCVHNTPPVKVSAPPQPEDCTQPGQLYSDSGVPDCNAGIHVDGHTFFDVCGSTEIPFISQFCDAENAATYAAQGDIENVGWSLVGLAPLFGNIATATRAARGLSAACSFSGDTEVLMADGTTKPISQIKIGDEVIAADPETGEKGPRTVTAAIVHEDTVVKLSTADGSTVTTTEDHPFYNATDRVWERADQLDPGDTLLTATGEHTRIVGLLPATAYVDLAYNLTVEDLHTYHVQVGAAAVLVHNDCGINVFTDDFGATWAKVPGTNDYARVERAGGTLSVTDVFRKDQDVVRGSDLVAAALHAEYVKPGEVVIISNIINQQTIASWRNSESAGSSLLGRTAESALSKLGMRAASIDWHYKGDKLNIAIMIG